MTANVETERAAYYEICAYTLVHGDPKFIHQHVVDAFAAQFADERSKPITIAFALIGLYLHLDRGYSGREVQRVHMRLARRNRAWPRFAPPADRGDMRPSDVLVSPAGQKRDAAIEAWCASVWAAWGEHHDAVAALLREMGE